MINKDRKIKQEECMIVIINKTPLTLKELEDNYGIY